jgi:hypothetical protein
MNDLDLIVTRDVTDDELPFVLNKWLHTFKRSRYSGPIASNLYTAVYSNTIQQLIERGMKIRIFAGKDIDTILGFVAFEPGTTPVVHYGFMKPAYRRHGLFAALCARDGIDLKKPFLYTFKTRYARYFQAGTYAPHIARRKELGQITPIPERGSHGRKDTTRNSTDSG